ncbi:M20/M25/M40 family metallo-hydrolase [Pseudoduganella eburnea]|uniref:M20/M25/M40 family metallo-hydrolase n=1 Tax=Massilia eburnea TaxID=1776165 RepID=A0A6L6QEP8_9BURK|nr:M20/M25/M40 family metallo-hydrolase [Massilia eburnea]MTW10600.1 M20/M25/M40 family metallo-hydrolase [Massilia eburnea]
MKIFIFSLLFVTSGAIAQSIVLDQQQLLDDVRILASTDFGGRATGTGGNHKARTYLRKRFEAVGIKAFPSGYEQAFTFTRRFWRTTENGVNLMGYIPGTRSPKSYLVISAHYDHLGSRKGKLYPGADDNASGVAVMLAAAAWFKPHPPAHSILFVTFDAEELGMKGSRYFVSALPVPKEQVVMNLNLDMVSRNDKNEIYVAGISKRSDFKPLVQQAAARSTVAVRYGHDSFFAHGDNWTDSSDQAPFNDEDIPFLMFGVEDHADYHQPSDTFEHIQQDFFAKTAHLIVDTATVLDQHLDEVKAKRSWW